MVTSLSTIKSEVHSKIRKLTIDALDKYLAKKDPSLWGIEKPRSFRKSQLYIQLYKDMNAIGYCKLEKETKSWNKITLKSLRTNTRRIRYWLSKWGKKQIQIGALSDWSKAKRNVVLGKQVEDANLWMDSTDCPLKGKYSISKKDKSWSYKLGCPGQRYMTIVDGRTRFRYVEGGYSPKLFDGHFLKLKKNELKKNFKDGVVLADSHFSMGRSLFKKIKFHTNIAATKKNKKRDRSESSGLLCDKHRTYNQQHQAARSRVEGPNGIVKCMFKALEKPWFETETQQDHLFHLACGIHNRQINNK